MNRLITQYILVYVILPSCPTEPLYISICILPQLLLCSVFINECVFSDSYKVAHVIPLFKGGDKEDSNCYRPISLLPTISKILEKLLATRLIKFLTKYKVLSKDQFGFRAKFSTEYAIVDIYDKLIRNLDEGLSSCAIFFHLAKGLFIKDVRCLGGREGVTKNGTFPDMILVGGEGGFHEIRTSVFSQFYQENG